MSKKETIDAIANAAGVSKKDTLAVLDALQTEAAIALRNSGEFNLHGVCKITVSHKPARQARNPRTGDTVSVPESKGIKFKVSSTLKSAVQ